MLIRNLTDIVSKGGNLLLNVGPDQKGRFPEQTEPILKAFDKWLSINGEAIYATQPWRTFGESVAAAEKEVSDQGAFHDAEYDGTPKNIIPDIRYTRKGNNVYAIVRHVASDSYTLSAFSPATDRVMEVTLLENGENVRWALTEDGLSIKGVNRGLLKDDPKYVMKVSLATE